MGRRFGSTTIWFVCIGFRFDIVSREVPLPWAVLFLCNPTSWDKTPPWEKSRLCLPGKNPYPDLHASTTSKTRSNPVPISHAGSKPALPTTIKHVSSKDLKATLMPLRSGLAGRIFQALYPLGIIPGSPAIRQRKKALGHNVRQTPWEKSRARWA